MMNFIERLWHIAPDGGNGMTELAVILVCLLAPLAVRAWRLMASRADS